jgi:hypothetical protein
VTLVRPCHGRTVTVEERNGGVNFVGQPPHPPSHDCSIHSETDEFRSSQLVIGASLPYQVDGFSAGVSKSTITQGKTGLGSKLQMTTDFCLLFLHLFFLEPRIRYIR